ncbi:hypothetical protein HII12_002650 [Brettanomyces bruxellensis]|uniref:Protein CASP n=1 Tax=Dekkera bruxellensis TaxID=5007 RepID=A0A8H6BGC8_DEKBR|nr:hypothetical protein HII12_002650 [Brettanomyces bruxellensis]
MSAEDEKKELPSSDSAAVSMADMTKLLEKALKSWSIADLPSLQKDLDSNALKFQDYQKDSLVSRRNLAKRTKAFKKLSDEDKVAEIKGLLKIYQQTIDDLAKKNKTVDQAFFKIYRSIAEAPDPRPLLEMSSKSVNSINELDDLREQNKQLENKLVKYADYDQIKQENVKLKENGQKSFEKDLEAKDAEWHAMLEEKTTNWETTRTDYERRLKEMTQRVEDMKVEEEMLKLRLQKRGDALDEIDLSDNEEKDASGGEEGGNAGSSMRKKAANSLELEMVSQDAERSKLRVLELEKRNEELRREIASTKVTKKNEKDSKVDDRISELESENSILVARLDAERRRAHELESKIISIQKNSKVELGRATGEVDELKKYRDKTHDYEQIKRELEVLKQIELGSDEDEADEAAGSGNSGADKSAGDVNSVIAQRNRKLNNEIIEYRTKNNSLLKKLQAAEDELEALKADLAQSESLNKKLEADLESVEDAASNEKWDTMSMISSIAPGGSIAGGESGRKSPAGSIAGSIAGETKAGSIIMTDQQDSSIVPILARQRDRFRKKNKELEEENKKNFSKVVELKREIQRMKEDNKDLYEKIRFMEYRQVQNDSENDLDPEVDDVEDRYKESYETQLHPIERFRRMEGRRISSRMSPFERVFVHITKLVLSTQYTRWLFVFHCIGLHFLILLLTVFLMVDSNSEMPDNSVLGGSTGGIAGGGKANRVNAGRLPQNLAA